MVDGLVAGNSAEEPEDRRQDHSSTKVGLSIWQGKMTDTASVLQEASLYIKLLQGQIQHLFQMLSSSYSSISPLQLQENGKKQIDLRSRGLCLVPVSSIQGVTKETKVDNHSIHHYSH
ncbi:hypothetical protein CDL15_Pgr025921 [Punica granatum]|uniref:BHLH domain-containing protein n=1 Tax=Punica granatum TaxID=22663 RepID=A0A218WDC0_PUNGR|nr:hypothetical protein CDL15_Pgr025921 [Punica granatum]